MTIQPGIRYRRDFDRLDPEHQIDIMVDLKDTVLDKADMIIRSGGYAHLLDLELLSYEGLFQILRDLRAQQYKLNSATKEYQRFRQKFRLRLQSDEAEIRKEYEAARTKDNIDLILLKPALENVPCTQEQKETILALWPTKSVEKFDTECEICCEQYDSDQHQKVTVCNCKNNAVCRACVRNWILAEQPLICPFCRSEWNNIALLNDHNVIPQ